MGFAVVKLFLCISGFKGWCLEPTLAHGYRGPVSTCHGNLVLLGFKESDCKEQGFKGHLGANTEFFVCV